MLFSTVKRVRFFNNLLFAPQKATSLLHFLLLLFTFPSTNTCYVSVNYYFSINNYLLFSVNYHLSLNNYLLFFINILAFITVTMPAQRAEQTADATIAVGSKSAFANGSSKKLDERI